MTTPDMQLLQFCPPPAPEIKCSKCKEFMAPKKFHRNKAAKSGRTNYCKVCWSIYRKELRACARMALDPKEEAELAQTLVEYGWGSPTEPAST